MKHFLVFLGLLCIAQSCLSTFTFEDGIIYGTLQHKASKRCIKFERFKYWPAGTCEVGIHGAGFQPCTDNVCTMGNSGCVEFILDLSGHLKQRSDDSLCLLRYKEFNLYRGKCDQSDVPTTFWRYGTLIDGLSMDSSGVIYFDNGRRCIRKKMSSVPIPPDRWNFQVRYEETDKMLGVGTDHSSCQDDGNKFRLVAPGTSWFSFNTPSQAEVLDLTQNHCNYRNRRLCTATEVCPNSPEGQSIVGVMGEITNSALLVAGNRILDAATCQKVAHAQLSSYTVGGVVCCLNNVFPSPTDFISDGYGYFMHKSGKCIHLVSQRLVLKSDCAGGTALMRWSSEKRITHNGNCIVPNRLGRCPPFQFARLQSLQDVYTGGCLVPDLSTTEQQLDPPEDTALAERADCGRSFSRFVFKRLHGFIKHSSDSCLGVSGDKLVIKSTCDSPDQVFYKEGYSSQIIHVVSGRCVANPATDTTALTLVTDCTTNGGTFTYDGTRFGYGADKCIKPRGGGVNPSAEEELVAQPGCTDAVSTFEFAAARFCAPESCTCVEGYEMSGDNCFPINNCETNNGGCQGNAECVYTGPGTSMCLCPPGFRLGKDGTTCSQCPEKNCFKSCQFVDDNELRRITSLKEHVELRFFNFKTSDLIHYVGSTTTQLVVYAHQTTISGTLTLPSSLAKVAIFTNELLVGNGGRIDLPTNVATRTAVVEVVNGKLLCKNSYPNIRPWPGIAKGTVFNIYKATSSTPFTCSGNYNAKDNAIQAAIKSKGTEKEFLDADIFSLVLDCARVVAQGNAFAKDKKLLRGSLPVRLTQNVLDEIRKAKSEGKVLTDTLESLRLNAKTIMEDLTLRARGIYKVPYLSLKAHEKVLALLKDDAKMAIEKYARYERISQDFNAGIEATESMTELMTAIVKRNDLDVEALQRELKTAISDKNAMQKKFREAKSGLAAAKETFEQGVKEYRNKMVANAIFSILGGITSIFAGGAGAGLGFAIELSSLAADISKLTRTMYKLSIVMDSISKIAEAATTFTELHYDILPYAKSGASDYYSKSLPEQNDQSLAVLLKEWDVFEREADAFLGQGTPANDISGTSDYLAALLTVAVWGRGYHEKTITVQELMASVTKLKILKVEQQAAQQRIQTSRETAVEQQAVNGELLIEMALQKQRLRNIMVDKLMSFCDSYFYNWLSECPVMPTMSDDLYALHDKINQGLTAAINAVENFAPFIPQEFEATVTIRDEKGCTVPPSTQGGQQGRKRSKSGSNDIAVNTLKCPISELKRSKGFLFRLKEDDPDIFLGHERVHIDEIEIYYIGASINSGKTITTWISFTGMMSDIFRGQRYDFLSPPRVTEFSYKTKPGNIYEVVQPGKVSSKFQEYYDGVAATTTWSVSIPKSYNDASLSLAGVTEVKIKLKGTRVPVKEVEAPKVNTEPVQPVVFAGDHVEMQGKKTKLQKKKKIRKFAKYLKKGKGSKNSGT